jgi:hypothetical protein
MNIASAAPTKRRGFLQRLAAAAVALTATGWGTIQAQGSTNRQAARTRPLSPDDAWVGRIRGKHRQVIDAVEPNGGFAAAYAANIVDGYKQTHSVANADITPVIVFRHMAMPLTLKDEVWAKYKLGEFLKVNDPKTNAPAARNIFRENVPLHPGLTYETMAKGPYVIVACNLALTVLSSMTAQNAGVTAEQAKQDWTAGVLPGVALAPSGVYAVSRAQETGCHYCYGG